MEECKYHYSNSHQTYAHQYLRPTLVKLIKESLRSQSAKVRILELGCGNGNFCGVLSEYGYDVVGVEPSEEGVSIAAKAYPNCSFTNGNIYDLPYEKLLGGGILTLLLRWR